MTQAIKGYMTTSEAAKYLEYDPDYVCQLCIDGKLIGATKFGKMWAIPEKSVYRYPKRKEEEKKTWLNMINTAIREGTARKTAQRLATA